MKRHPKCILIFFLLLGSVTYAATIDNSEVCFRADISVGGASYFGSLGVIGKIDAFVQKGRFLLQPRYTYITEIGNMFGRDLPGRHTDEIGLLSGVLLFKGNIIAISLTGGLSYINGQTRGALIDEYRNLFADTHYEKITYSTIGVPLDFQFRCFTQKLAGIGFSIAASINKPCPYIGFLVTATIGKVK